MEQQRPPVNFALPHHTTPKPWQQPQLTGSSCDWVSHEAIISPASFSKESLYWLPQKAWTQICVTLMTIPVGKTAQTDLGPGYKKPPYPRKPHCVTVHCSSRSLLFFSGIQSQAVEFPGYQFVFISPSLAVEYLFFSLFFHAGLMRVQNALFSGWVQ